MCKKKEFIRRLAERMQTDEATAARWLDGQKLRALFGWSSYRGPLYYRRARAIMSRSKYGRGGGARAQRNYR